MGGGNSSLNHAGFLSDNFEVGKILGEGSFGTIYKAVSKVDDQTYAIKKLKNIGSVEANTIQEFEIMKRISYEGSCHPHIVCYYDIFKAIDDKGVENIYVVMEFINGNSLYDKMSKVESQNKKLPMPTIKKYMKQLLETMAFMHNMGMVHLDLKPENIMINENGDIVILDFGFACSIIEQKIKCNRIAGTDDYMSPELVMARLRLIPSLPDMRAYLESDVWSLGIMFMEMMEGKPISGFEQIVKQLGVHPDSFDELIKRLEPVEYKSKKYPNIENIISRALVIDYRKRATVNELLEML